VCGIKSDVNNFNVHDGLLDCDVRDDPKDNDLCDIREAFGK
jgi:hypothetical protein